MDAIFAKIFLKIVYLRRKIYYIQWRIMNLTKEVDFIGSPSM